MNIGQLRKKFTAWWEGVDAAPEAENQPAYSVPPSEAPQSGTDPANSQASGYRPNAPTLEAHLTIAQSLWGQGFVGPGDAAFILDIVSQLIISKEKTVGYLGLGLGGPAREITKETGAWITGYETREQSVKTAREQCMMAGLAKKVTVEPFVPGETALPKNRFHVMICRDELCFIPDKEEILKGIYKALTKGGLCLITDYVHTGRQDADLSKCFSSVWGTPSLWPADRYPHAFLDLGFDLRVQADLTPQYISMIANSSGGWSDLMRLAESGSEEIGDKRGFVMALASEAAVWAERLNAMRNGELGVYRYILLKS